MKKLGGLLKSILEIRITQKEEPEFNGMIAVGDKLLELMPKPLLPCSFEGCGRKFATEELLKDHWNRRHA